MDIRSIGIVADQQKRKGKPQKKRYWVAFFCANTRSKFKGWHEIFYYNKPNFKNIRDPRIFFRCEHFPTGETCLSTLDFRRDVEFVTMAFPEKQRWLKKKESPKCLNQ